MNSGIDYKLFYDVLLNLREDFHSYGRIDDSNAKLDEIIKIIVMSYYKATQGIRFSLRLIKEASVTIFGNENQVASTLRIMFEETIKSPLFINKDGTSIFGANPSLTIQPSENLFAEKLISEIEKIDFVNLISDTEISNFDVINECFGHFVRENFRNNKEDAQYMTPAEITAPIISMVFHDFEAENYFDNVNPSNFKIMDPTCGVGTLIIESARKFVEFLKAHHKTNTSLIHHFLENGILGQDKVDRMVRLSKINMLLFGANSQNIFNGNSISDVTNIDSYKGKIDFIFTNPPFRADYLDTELSIDNFSFPDNFTPCGMPIKSEVLMLLKCLNLLKPNGKLAIVLPDSVFSSSGINEYIRKYLVENYTINAIYEMPSVTFAQAGTRTITSILYLTKKKPLENHKILMCVCNDIGYTVKERMGVPVKIHQGRNEMEIIANLYSSLNSNQDYIIHKQPSMTLIKTTDLINGILNPNFYSADRISMINSLENNVHNGFEMRDLSEVVRFDTIGRKNKSVSENVKHISVLHVNPDCTIDFQQVLSFKPISKGRQCKKGDLLFSKINPRIPRMTVVPEFESELVCSNEFEILIPQTNIGAYALCLLLKTSYVTKQIENLTSGTSSSHNRIKREQLAKIRIPFPNSTQTKNMMIEINETIKKAFNQKYQADQVLREQQKRLESII